MALLPGQQIINGVSNFVFGSNMSVDFATHTVRNTAQMQTPIKNGNFTLMRCAIPAGSTDAYIDLTANACAAMNCAMLVILIHDNLTYNKHLVSYLGSRCLLYEFSNEPDLYPSSGSDYLGWWNSQIPVLRGLNPSAAFIGPALGVFANMTSYVTPWLQGCLASGNLPDGISYHVYPCTGDSSSTHCATRATAYASCFTQVDALVSSILGFTLPQCMTEWNIDANYQTYTLDPAFNGTWTTTALNTIAASGYAIACQYDAGGGAAGGTADLVSTQSPYPTQVQYQPMVSVINSYIAGSGSGGGSNNSRLVGPDTPIGLTQGTKNNAALSSQMIPDLLNMGIRWLRWQPYANSIELSQGNYTWGNLDSVVSQCNAAGINLHLTVLFPPTWGQITTAFGSGIPSPSWTKAFATAMAQRYDGNHGHGIIQGMGLGNEDYGFPDDPTDLANTMNLCYPALKNAYPTLTIGPGCALHRNTAKIQDFFSTLWQKAPGKFDFTDFHYYCQNNNSSDPSVGGSGFSSFPDLLTIMQQAASAAGFPNFPIGITETGWPVNSNGGFAAQYVVDPNTQANYLKYELDRLKALWQQTGTKVKLWIYTLGYANQGTPATGIGNSLGMSLYQVNYGGNPLPAYTMVKNYDKNWGGGSNTSATQATRDITLRAGLVASGGVQTLDIALRAGLQTAQNQVVRDIALRAGLVGATVTIADTFSRANNAASWGNASDGETWVQAGGTAAASIASNEGVLSAASLSYDSFTRANQSGFGTASDGETWTKYGTGTASIANNEGVLTSVGSDTNMQLGTTTAIDADVSCRIALGNSGDICAVQARFTGVSGPNTTCYKLLFYSGGIHLNKSISGTITNLANQNFTMTPGVFYWFRLVVSGSSISGKVWADGTQEPAAFQLSVTDTSITAAAGAAVLANTVSGSSGVQFNSFTFARSVSGSGTNTMRLGVQTLADVEGLARFQVTQAGDIIGITLRDTGLSNFVRLRLTATQLQLVQQTPAGGFVVLGSYAFVPVGGTFYWLKFRALGSNLYGKLWQSGTSEPANWLLSGLTTVLAAGQVGFSCALASGGDTAQFDSFSAVSAATSGLLPNTRTKDVMLRAGLVARVAGVQQLRDIALRAGLVDVSKTAITVTTYPAKRPPLSRRFPKS